MQTELDFTLSQLNKMKQKVPNIEINTQLYTNSLMFKENLKLICAFSIEQIWKKCLNQKKSEPAEQASNFEQILEEDEEVSQEQSIPSQEDDNQIPVKDE